MLLTVEMKTSQDRSVAEVAVCFDEKGLELLIEKLSYLRGKRDHVHLMTPAWAGNELTDSKQGGGDYEIVNHLRLVKL